MSELLANLVAQLSAADAPRESLAQMRAGRKVGPFTQPERLEIVGECWRLGALLIGADGKLYATGYVIRSAEERRASTLSELARQRNELRAAARRGKIAAGVTLNVGYREVSLAAPTHPLAERDGMLQLEWSPGLWMPVDAYLRERAELLIHRPTHA